MLKGFENWLEKLPISDQHKAATNFFFKINESHFDKLIKHKLPDKNRTRAAELFKRHEDEKWHHLQPR